MDALLDFMARFGAEFWHIVVESGVWLVIGLAFAGVIHAFVPRSWFTRHLAGRGFGPIAKASLLGIPMPLCSCSVIPVAAGLRRQGAGRGASAAFAISTPQTGEESIPLTWALFGPVFALARPVIAVVTALLAGLLIESTAKPEPQSKPSPESDVPDDPGAISLGLHPTNAAPPTSMAAVDRPQSCCSSTVLEPRTPVSERVRTAWHHGFVTMLRDLAPWLAVGLVLAAFVAAAVPQGWIAEHVGTGLWPKVAMLFVGIPLYICATSSTPLAFSLVAAGLSPGAAIVLLLAGPATNLATMSWVIKDLGVRALVVYLAVIAAVALGAGVLFDAFLAGYVAIGSPAVEHAHTHGGAVGLWDWTKVITAGVFGVLLLWALLARIGPVVVSALTPTPPAPQPCCSASSSTQDRSVGAGSSCGCATKP